MNVRLMWVAYPGRIAPDSLYVFRQGQGPEPAASIRGDCNYLDLKKETADQSTISPDLLLPAIFVVASHALDMLLYSVATGATATANGSPMKRAYRT